ncbi:DUF6766 family protein [Streptomyces sp. NPDC020858]|uniref:DUF6766 family protein n=1 Tax=Streptomyces sp. NPDC020858 TaxID=3365097 RepID=UPI00379DAA21
MLLLCLAGLFGGLAHAFTVGPMQRGRGSEFWNRTLRNWQSELLAVASMVRVRVPASAGLAGLLGVGAIGRRYRPALPAAADHTALVVRGCPQRRIRVRPCGRAARPRRGDGTKGKGDARPGRRQPALRVPGGS